MNFKRNYEENGITLIVLVVMIIVLLILAAVSIVTLTGEDGILAKASDAEEETRGASVEEARDLWKINQKADNYTDGETAQKLEELIKDLVNQKLLTEDEKDQILGNESKEIEATYRVTIGSRTIEFATMAIEYLKAGDYVNYIDKNGNEIKCRVLYDKAYNKARGTNYGLQIIAANPVDIVTLGWGDQTLPTDMASKNNFEKARYSYNNAITTLNDKAETYRNPKYTDEGKARCVGSVPDNPSSEASDYFTSSYSYMLKYNETFKNADDNYIIDEKRLGNLGLKGISDTSIASGYWVCSRAMSSSSEGTFFYVRYSMNNGFWTSVCLDNVHSNDDKGIYSVNQGFRPVFCLKANVEIDNSNGKDGTTKDKAYDLK